jgi:hypothetical protein
VVPHNASHRRKCLGGKNEWLVFPAAHQMSVPPVIEADWVHVYLPGLHVRQDEALRNAFHLPKSLVCEHRPHPDPMGVPHDEVEVFMFARLLPYQGIHTPAAVQPHINPGSSEPPDDFGDI